MIMTNSNFCAFSFAGRLAVTIATAFLLMQDASTVGTFARAEEAAAPPPASNGPVCTGKRLVVVTGPRRSATTSVAEFFHLYARGSQFGRANGKIYHPLANFRWPMVYGVESNKTEIDRPYKRFNHLVTDPDNEALRKEIIDAIVGDYNQQYVQAVIFGGEEFDQVGDIVGHDNNNAAIRAIKDVQAATGAPDECVTIVINYRVPRFEHWVSLYSSKTLLESGEDYGVNVDADAAGVQNPDNKPDAPNQFQPYTEHMCLESSSYDRMYELLTSMNPMYLAEIYLNRNNGNDGNGWKVTMVDMGGVNKVNGDITHTIGCEILGGKCTADNRWVKGHLQEKFFNAVLERDYNSLPEMEIDNSEKLFRYRDCAYKYDLESNERFSIIKQDSIWSDCSFDDPGVKKIYQSLRTPVEGTWLVYDALLSQVDCSEYGEMSSVPSNSIEEILEGIHLKKNEHFTFEGLQDKFDEHHLDLDVGYYHTDISYFHLFLLVLVLTCTCCCCKRWCKRRRATSGYSIPRIEMKNVGNRNGGSSSNGGSGRGSGNRNGGSGRNYDYNENRRGGNSNSNKHGKSYRDQLKTMYNSEDDDDDSDDGSSSDESSSSASSAEYGNGRGYGQNGNGNDNGSNKKGVGGFMSRFKKNPDGKQQGGRGKTGDFI